MAKGPEAFRTISEAADEVGVPQHVLRFWETKFSFIRPMKRAGGRRFYRPADLQVLRGIRRLLHDEGYTIRGVQRLHKEEGVGRLTGAPSKDSADTKPGAVMPATGVNGAEGGSTQPPVQAAKGRTASPGPDLARLHKALAELEAAKARLDRALGED